MTTERTAKAAELELEDRIERYWDLRSSEFSKVRRTELASQDAALWLKLIEKHLPPEAPLKILDAGTGAGFFAIILSRMGHDVTGIDMSEEMVHEARKNTLQANCHAVFCKMNAQALVFPDESFDAVISRNLTWTLPDVMQAYREWKRVLKSGGMLLNFDSDYGCSVFARNNDKANVHAMVTDAQLNECNSIKDKLRISAHQRPSWDISYLASLGFDVQFDNDVSSFVHQDKNLSYDNIPLFAIYAKKC